MKKALLHISDFLLFIAKLIAKMYFWQKIILFIAIFKTFCTFVAINNFAL